MLGPDPGSVAETHIYRETEATREGLMDGRPARLMLTWSRRSIVSSYFITYPRVPWKNRTEEGATVIHIEQARKLPSLFLCWTLKGNRTTGDRRFTVHLILSVSFLLVVSLPLPFLMSASSSQLTQVELSWAVTTSYSVLSHYTSVICEERDWEFSFNSVPESMHGVSEVKVCLWRVHPAKRGIL